jgi:hypothetical protein
MTRTVDLSILGRNPQRYVRRWKKKFGNHMASESAGWFMTGEGCPGDPDLWFQFGRTSLCVVLRNGRRPEFPLDAVPEQSPFKKRELSEGWDSFISMFIRPPIEIEDMHTVSGYEE